MRDARASEALEVVLVTAVVLRERWARDRARWQELASCYSEESTVKVSWFAGSGREFVAASEDMAARGTLTRHRLAAPVVRVNRRRALVELPAGIETRARIEGVEVDLVSYARLQYRLERIDEEWLIVSLDSIYERDTISPVIPGDPIALNRERLPGLRASYGLLACVLEDAGFAVDTELLGDDRPEDVEALYRSQDAWLADA